MFYLVSFFKYFFKGCQIKYASKLPISAVTNWTVEKVVLPIASCFSLRLLPKRVKRIFIIETAINTDLTMEPITMPAGMLPTKLIFLLNSQTEKARMQLPIIIMGITAGIAVIIGDAVIKYAVMGAMMEMIRPLKSPTASTAIIMIVLTIGPVM